jgi:hypothetical protein
MATTKNKQRKTAKAATKPRARAAPPKSPPKAAPKSPPRPSVKAPPKPVVTRPVPKAVDKPEPTPSSQPQPFRLVAIERTEPPRGADGKNWYRYTITQGANAINGYLQGTANGVKHAAEQIVGQLNERRAGRWGYRTTRAAAPAQAS